MGALMEEDTVRITQAELDELLEDQKKLRALEAGGVDNWSGYYLSLEYED